METEVYSVAQVRRREEEILAIEQVERLRAQLKRHWLAYACLLQNTHVFTVERRRVNIAERRSERAEEPQRISVISRVSSRADRRSTRIVVKAWAKLWRSRERRRIDRLPPKASINECTIALERLAGRIQPEVPKISGQLQEVSE